MQPTLDQVREHRDALIAKFGTGSPLGMADVSQTQFSIARYSGGCVMDGRSYSYNAFDDSLIRDDVVKWLVKKAKEKPTPRSDGPVEQSLFTDGDAES